MAAMQLGMIATAERGNLVALTIAVSLLEVVTCGTLIGSSLPFVLQGLNLDPAAGSTPMVTTVVDVCGLLLYFTTAVLVLGL